MLPLGAGAASACTPPCGGGTPHASARSAAQWCSSSCGPVGKHREERGRSGARVFEGRPAGCEHLAHYDQDAGGWTWRSGAQATACWSCRRMQSARRVQGGHSLRTSKPVSDSRGGRLPCSLGRLFALPCAHAPHMQPSWEVAQPLFALTTRHRGRCMPGHTEASQREGTPSFKPAQRSLISCGRSGRAPA